MLRVNIFELVLLTTVLCVTNCALVVINCVPLVKCPELLNLVEADRNSQKTIRLLRTSHCGYHAGQPKVWCTEVQYADCKTPNGKIGKCTELNQCELLHKLISNENELADIQAYIKNSKCKRQRSETNKQHICCPPDDDISLIKTTELITNSPEISPTSATTNLNILPNPEKDECGHQLSSKIIGGQNTQLDEFPWTALLQYQLRTQFSTNCGGTLISRRYVITAAHCVDSSAIRSVGRLVNVILGEFDTRNETDCINVLGIISCADAPVVVPVEAVFLHPNWYTKPAATINNDIALIRLSVDIKFTDYIRPICLPSSTMIIQDNVQLIVAGWGQTESERSSPVKLKTTVPLSNKGDCVAKYRNDKRLIVGDGQICVGGEEGKDSCSGDSGGPLMYESQQNEASTWFLVGVVSFGPNQPCGIKNYPGLYTYLPKYVDWIHATVQT